MVSVTLACICAGADTNVSAGGRTASSAPLRSPPPACLQPSLVQRGLPRGLEADVAAVGPGAFGASGLETLVLIMTLLCLRATERTLNILKRLKTILKRHKTIFPTFKHPVASHSEFPVDVRFDLSQVDP